MLPNQRKPLLFLGSFSLGDEGGREGREDWCDALIGHEFHKAKPCPTLLVTSPFMFRHIHRKGAVTLPSHGHT
jgi:hypothetical protein